MWTPRPTLPPARDVALAALVTALAEVDVVAPSLFSTHLTGPRWSVAALFAVAGISLAWRRTYPATVFAVVVDGLLAQALLVGASEGNGTLVPILVATYSVAAHGSRRSAYGALAVLPLLMLVRETHNAANVDWPATRDALAWDLTLVAAWLTGSWMRARRLYEASLVDRAYQAERERESAAEAAIAEERVRMARELHDAIAHSLTVVVVQAEAAEDALDRDPAAARTPLRHIGATGRAALMELRQVVGALRSAEAVLPAAGGRRGVEALMASADAAGLRTHLAVGGDPRGVAAAVQQAVYRVVQESLTNVLRHSRSGEVSARVVYGADLVEVEVLDAGPAVPVNGRTPGHGLVGMRERVTALGGRLQAGAEPYGGFRVHASIPTGRHQ